MVNGNKFPSSLDRFSNYQQNILGSYGVHRGEESAPMIIVRIRMNVLPEKQKEVVQTLHSMIDKVGKEKGCMCYDVLCDIEGKAVFDLLEEWETREDLDRHIRSEEFTVLLGTKSLLANPMELKIHTVSHSEGVEVVNAIRVGGTSEKDF
jgi:quinol monooxygenase YgiN